MLSSKVVARVFHEDSFKEPSTRITATAAVLSTEYIRLFIREAVLRANNHRVSEGGAMIDGIDNVHDDSISDINDQLNSDDTSADRGSGVSTQVPPNTDGNDILATRHLAAISGLLVMDF